jgi:hypothetical protein
LSRYSWPTFIKSLGVSFKLPAHEADPLVVDWPGKPIASYLAMVAATMRGVAAGRVSMPHRPSDPLLAVASTSPALR